MKRNNPQIAVFMTVIVLLAAALGIYLLSAKASELSAKIAQKKSMNDTEELINLVKDYDFDIYFLGSVPEELAGIDSHIIRITPERLNGDFMPIYWGEIEFTRYDEDGNEVEHHVPRDYAEHMLIVINSDFTLDEDDLEILRNCSVDNHVPLFFIGGDNANQFRNYLILGTKDYGTNGTMIFSGGRTSNGPVLGEGDGSYIPRDVANAVLNYVIDILEINVESGEV